MYNANITVGMDVNLDQNLTRRLPWLRFRNRRRFREAWVRHNKPLPYKIKEIGFFVQKKNKLGFAICQFIHQISFLTREIEV